ncbi:prsS10B (nucleomorph) [Hemiselmis andersenii]|uniref:PrsS10B n=1 Tax=Hemiselmis andersenii TaxID=464988 RepID=A9BKN9_HEMAN|nr:prsS10B [Hemiselmis andersenii]ABW98044.1 prsS10B [Hemiselmis andersenii]|mmetsp:Transcript_12154/g.28410  ORF Transcript_12154/g.28410 Transcript_12154/m.28410 type:complete len:390 (-) Transcript_12154:242-1411(-)
MIFKKYYSSEFLIEKLLKEFLKLRNNQKKHKNLSKEIKNLDKMKKNKKIQNKNQKEIGLLLGEVIKGIGKNRFIIKSTTGTRYITSSQIFEERESIKEWNRVGLDPSTFNIMKILTINSDPILEKMLKSKRNPAKYIDVGGLEKEIEKLREIIQLSLVNPEIFFKIGIKIPKGVLLHGPPGTGKTLLAKSIAFNIKATFLKIVASGIVDKYIGESARIIREIFSFAKQNTPCIIFIDEIDAIGGRRFSEGSSADREIQRTLIELLNQLDGFEELLSVKTIMATNRPDVLDPALLRPGRLDRKLKIDLPDLSARFKIFKIYFGFLNQGFGIDFEKIMRLCVFFNGSDLRNLCTEAGLFAVRSHRNYIMEEDLLKAVKKVRKSKKIEGKFI